MLVLAVCFIVERIIAATLSNINGCQQRQSIDSHPGFNQQPVYAFFSLHNPERIVVDIRQSNPVQVLPLDLSGENMVKRIRTSRYAGG
ncbi:hypothetical protein [Sodalis-like endosymbiont of Proechinophthirus fluctus]|uniref:hypothetical protein n=1 Tax=Sodalis-like endosymbiont of Proechinophthirus fluctus TaxID=1462730 RepID=UPI001957C1AA|nr:hypothetical protein [Sodalis-like endosymbiont of Proechinophthirus fluctus]